MAGTFDFAPNSHVAEEIPPEEPEGVSMNGWEFASKPAVPYRRKFKLTLEGMRWIMVPEGGALDTLSDPNMNAGRLLEFWQANRRWDHFDYPHEYLGLIQCKFADVVTIPKAIQNSNGLIPAFEITLIHHNPGY